MRTCHNTVHPRWLLFAVAALLFSSSVLAAPAARVEFAVGNVSVLAADGRVRALAKGAAVEEGETVNTNEGRVQLRFSDDGFVSLHTGTVFRIDQYRWEGRNDGSERNFFSLIKGGLRTITGKLTKQNRKAYKMTTMVATIGIRGTEYTMQLNGDLSGSVAEGEIEVCNAGGCLAVAAGQSYYVPDAKIKPIFSNKQTYLVPPQPRGGTTPIRGTTSTVGGVVTTNGGLVDTTTTGLFNTLNSTTTGVIGLTQGVANSLLGGTALNQSVQGITGAAGAALSGTTSTLSGATSGLLDTTGGLVGGLIVPVTGATGTLTGGILGTGPLLGPIKLGF